jgi:NTE family protein
MGAVVGGLYAADKLDDYADWITNFDKVDVFKLLDFTFSFQGFVRGEKVFNEMRKLLGDILIEDMNIPFTAVASNVRRQEEVLFSKGNLMDALRASCAIPTVVTPAYINNEEIVDGGVLNPIPMNHVKRVAGDIMVAVDVNANIVYNPPAAITENEIAREEKYMKLVDDFRDKLKSFWPVSKETITPTNKKFGYFDLLNKSIDLMQERMTDLQMQLIKPDMVIKISRDSCGTFEFYRSKELIKEGELAFNRANKKYQDALESNQ